MIWDGQQSAGPECGKTLCLLQKDEQRQDCKCHCIWPGKGTYLHFIKIISVVLLADEHLLGWLKAMEKRVLHLHSVHKLYKVIEIPLVILNLHWK